MIFAGLDCGKRSVHVCILEQIPHDLKRFARRYKPQVLSNSAEDLETLTTLADTYFIEPTGVYSRIFIKALERAGKAVYLVPHRALIYYLRDNGIDNKSDVVDAAGLCCYGMAKFGNPDAFIKIQSEELRQFCSKLWFIQRSKDRLRNYISGRLEYEFPEFAKQFTEADRTWLNPNPPAPYRFLAGEPVRRDTRRPDPDRTIGEGLSDFTRSLAQDLCRLELKDYQLEALIDPVLKMPEFEPYGRAFEELGVGSRLRATFLCHIHPFSRFLVDGKEAIEWVESNGSKRKSQRVKRNRSLSSFKLSLGMGTVRDDSGKRKSDVYQAGPLAARLAIWGYVKSAIVMPWRRPYQIVLDDLVEEFEQRNVNHWVNPDIINRFSEVTGKTYEVSSLMIQYRCLKATRPIDDNRIMLVGGRFCKMLYRKLVKSFN